MPIFDLTEERAFPDPELAHPNGIIGFGGDLEPGRLLQAYRLGIFPWFNEGDPIIWWSPDPRMVLYPKELKVSHSMRKILRDNTFDITFDTEFEAVVKACSEQPRPGQKGTWITPEMIAAYIKLHELGYAHSVEVWKNKKLVGGLYGVSIGGLFAGESMFSTVSNASKAGFIVLVKTMQAKGVEMIDCQVYTRHLESLGAREISRKRFLTQLKRCLEKETIKQSWKKLEKVY